MTLRVGLEEPDEETQRLTKESGVLEKDASILV